MFYFFYANSHFSLVHSFLVEFVNKIYHRSPLYKYATFSGKKTHIIAAKKKAGVKCISKDNDDKILL